MSLDIDGLSFGYRKQHLFDRLDAADLRRGTVAALVGPNGVGKSSLFRLVAGLLAARGGSIRLDGEDLGRLSPRRRSERVFLLSQQVSVRAALSVFDVVLLARKGARGIKASSVDIDRVEVILETLGIEHLAERMVFELSGGQQQLVALGQALVREPDVLLLDEPTSALDLRRQLEVMHLVRKITAERGMVTLAALHDLGFASRFADRFLLLHDGRIAADGEPYEVLSSPHVEAAYGVGIRLERTSHGSLVVEPYMR